jgi:hypothetical protein
MEKKELSGLARQLLQTSGAQTFFTQTEFDDAIAIAQAEIMHVAVETTKKAIFIERQACAELALQGTDEPVQTKTLEILQAERQRIHDAILNRIPSQRQ